MWRPAKYLFILALALAAAGCMRWDYVLEEDLMSAEHGLFIANQGNFQYGNATLSFYDPATDEVQNEVFIRANGFKLGDVAQSMVVRNGLLWVVVNNSHVVFALDANTFKEVGRIEGLTSPRYIHFVNDHKAYITQLWDNCITIVDPARFRITGHIVVPDMPPELGSTEQMVQLGDYVYCNCWSYQNRIIKIDATCDCVVDWLEPGVQPQSLALDCHGMLWTVTDGGYEGSPYGNEPARLHKIDLETFSLVQSWTFAEGSAPRQLQTDASGTHLYWLDDHVWCMPVDDTSLPTVPLIDTRGTLYYGLTISPYNGDVYIADAIDYQQSGMIYRYSPSGELLSEFYVGVIPGAFAWK